MRSKKHWGRSPYRPRLETFFGNFFSSFEAKRKKSCIAAKKSCFLASKCLCKHKKPFNLESLACLAFLVSFFLKQKRKNQKKTALFLRFSVKIKKVKNSLAFMFYIRIFDCDKRWWSLKNLLKILYQISVLN